MTIREITEEEYIRLNRLNGFANQLLQNPESAKLLEKAAKIVDPNIRTPRLDQEAVANAPLAAVTETLAKLNQRLDDEAAARQNQVLIDSASRQREEGIRALRVQGWNDAGIAEIEKVMAEKGILDPVDAAIVFEKRQPLPTPAMPGSNGTFDFNKTMHAGQQTDADIKALLKTGGKESAGLDAVTNKLIGDTLQQVRSAQR